MENRCLWRLTPDQLEKIDDPLLELIIMIYLVNVTSDLIRREMIGTNDLKDAHFFQGPHVLKVAPLVERFGRDLAGFKKASENLGGESLDMGDVAYKFSPLPKIPLYYLLWEGDEEFKPRINVLFDRSIENVFAADAIWGLVNRVSLALIEGPTAIETNP